MRVLMLPISDRPESKVALQVTMGLADKLEANIVGCHLRPHRDAKSGYKTRGLPLFGSPNQDWLDELGRKSTESATRRAQKSFEKLTQEGGFKLSRRPHKNLVRGAIWRERVGVPDKLMAIMGPVSDMTVVTRPEAKGHVARMFLLAALLHSGRPVLVLPPNKTKVPGKRIAIGWNQSPEVARVVSACMPLIQQAEQVTIISAGSENRLGPKANQLQNYLKHYGVSSDVVVTRGRKEEAELAAAYKESKSDLMLMGAYSRARFRELVFGGMTQYMLSKSRLPVIMQHA
jgi:nucleotide-binding universal stress UspA family protein